MTDSVVMQIAGMVLTLVGTIFTGVMAYLMAKLNADQKVRALEVAMSVRRVARRAQGAAKKVEEVKQTLVETTAVNYRKLGNLQRSVAAAAASSDMKMDELATVANGTHKLVNSAMIVQLKISAMALRRVASLTDDPRDLEAADLAEQLLNEQIEKQKLVDAPRPTEVVVVNPPETPANVNVVP